MSSNKHPKGGADRADGFGSSAPRPPSDDDRNPGTGSSKGTFGRGSDSAVLEGENSSEGDVMNDVGKTGAVPEGRTGRTNK